MSPSRGNQQALRPAYFTLPVEAPQRRRPRNRAEGYWGRIDLEFRCITEVHVGSGAPELVAIAGGQVLVHGLTTLPGPAGAEPVIPGSSLKGAVRVVVEAITPSCLRVGGGGACSRADQLCPACELFGAPRWRAKIAFSDLTVRGTVELTPKGLAQRYSHKQAPRRGRRLYGLAPEAPQPAAMEHLLCLPAGTRLAGTLRLEGPTATELGILAIALGLPPRGLPMLRLGAGKNRGMAQVEVRLTGGAIAQGGASMARGALARIATEDVAGWQGEAFRAYPSAESRVAAIAARYRREEA